MVMSRRVSAFLLAFAAWTWLIWLNFLKNIWKDERAFDDGATSFFLVHLVLVVVSLLFGTVIGIIGWRGWRAARRSAGGLRAQRQYVANRD